TLGTTDGGEHWTVLSETPSLFSAGLLGLDFIDKTIGFGINVGGFILRTVDGGVTWEVAHDAQQTLWDIEFADPENGWAAGDNGVCVHTRDGGKTWEAAKHVVLGGDLRACTALDGDSVWVAGDWGTIAYTHDAGNSWQQAEGDGYTSAAHL